MTLGQIPVNDLTRSILLFVAHNRTGRLVATFCGFVLIQLVFGALYYLLFRRNRANFAFNTDILRSQSEVVRTETEASIVALSQVRSALVELSDQLDRGVDPVLKPKNAGASIDLPSGYVADMNFTVATHPVGVSPSGFASRFSILDPQRKILFAVQVPPTGQLVDWRHTRGQWQEVMPHFHAKLKVKMEAAEQRQASLATPTPDVWSYLDFLYFSTIVQTTVGFGDILPNTTTVRMLVAGQIVIGYGLLVVVLNVVLG